MIYILPFISGAIGWITNYLAIKMLFHPREERRFIFFTFHGIFPKRKKALARKLAKIVAHELFTAKNIKDKIESEVNIENLRASIEREIENYLRFKLQEKAPFLVGLIDEKRIIQLRDMICKEIDAFLPQIIDKLGEKIESVDIEDTVYHKVNNFSSEKLESLLMGVIKSELKFIEFAGAILGFLIGLIQVGLVMLTT